MSEVNYRQQWAEGEIEAGTLLDAIDLLEHEKELMCQSRGVAAYERDKAREERDAALAELAALKGGREVACYQFQTREGTWRQFDNERHYQDTLKAGGWPIRALYTAPPAQASAWAEGWKLAADALPTTGKPVLAYYLNSHGMGRRIRAMHVKRFTVEAEEFADVDTQCCEYSEQDDCYYTTEGWYELIDNWPDYASCAVIEGVITHWQTLPAAPTPGASDGKGGE